MGIISVPEIADGPISRSRESARAHRLVILWDRQSGRRGPVAASWLVAILSLVSASESLRGQEAIRLSVAGEKAAQERQVAANTPGYYNLQLGQTFWRFGAGLQVQYNDNAFFSSTGAQGDFIFLPQITTQFLWPFSNKQNLNLNLGMGYLAYAQHSGLNHAYISPNSVLSYDIYVGDFRINLHDRFSITENAYQDPTIAGTGGYSQLQNILGVETLWDLNKIILTVGYDHTIYNELSGGLNQPDRSGDIFSISAGYMFGSGFVAGPEAGGGFLHNSFINGTSPWLDASEWNVGAFLQAQISEHLRLTTRLGYTSFTPDAAGALPTAQSFTGFYLDAGITHRLNRFLEYTLSGGRILNSSLYGSAVDWYHVALALNWHVIEKWTLATSFQYQQGSEVYLGGENFEQYGPEIRIGRALTKKLSSGLSYQFYYRDSNLQAANYTVNIVSLDLLYQF